MKKRILYLLKYLLLIVGFIFVFFIVFVAYISIRDFQPDQILDSEVINPVTLTIDSNKVFDVISWNIGYAGLGKEMDFFYDGGEKVRPPRDDNKKYESGILEFISEQKPDFWFFQEVDKNSKRSYYRDQTKKISDLLQGYSHIFSQNYKVPFVPVPPTNPMGKVNSGIMFFSKYKNTEAKRYAYPNLASWPDNLFLLDRCFILSRHSLPNGKDLVMMNTHNSYYISEDSLRLIELNILKKIVLEEFDKGNYVIAGGDWNKFPPGFFEKTTIAKNMLQMDVKPIDIDFLPPGWIWVYDSDYPSNRMLDEAYQKGITEGSVIDYFVVSPNIEILSCETFKLDFEYADHNPVRMQFRLK